MALAEGYTCFSTTASWGRCWRPLCAVPLLVRQGCFAAATACRGHACTRYPMRLRGSQ